MTENSGKPQRTAVYTGSFDPITLGHLNVIERAARLVDRLVIGVGTNVTKKALFTPTERVELIERVTEPFSNVSVKMFSGLAVHFVRQQGAQVMVRGVRPLTDIAAEFTMMMANRQLDSEIETVFLMAHEEYSHVSSSLLKQIALLANEESLAKFVPEAIVEDIRKKMTSKVNS
ncbi:MAG: pantetheine-phosphate adenylyltransferase [Pirellulaceae bacterium]|nr:pantetheine-phosphate adenylyltransferase [Pirellulaceae bacterium]